MTGVLPFEDKLAGATFSDDRIHRYRLWRTWGSQPPACFCMLNPSTGNETELDPTLQRCVGFARRWQCGGIEIVNLFAVVSPFPNVLLTHPDPVGPDNDAYVLEASKRSETFVAAWGAFKEARKRAAIVERILRNAGVKLMCLGTTLKGYPLHPLYVPAATELISYVPPEAVTP